MQSWEIWLSDHDQKFSNLKQQKWNDTSKLVLNSDHRILIGRLELSIIIQIQTKTISLSLSLSHHSWIAPPMDQSLSSSSSSPIQFNLPPLSLSLFDGEPSSSEQPNEVFHGSTPSKHSSEPSSPTSSGYAAERGSASSTATSVSHVDEDSISHEIEEMNIHYPPPSVSNDSHDSCFPDERHLDEVYILPYSQFCFQHLVYCDWSRHDSVRCNLCHSV